MRLRGGGGDRRGGGAEEEGCSIVQDYVGFPSAYVSLVPHVFSFYFSVIPDPRNFYVPFWDLIVVVSVDTVKYKVGGHMTVWLYICRRFALQ